LIFLLGSLGDTLVALPSLHLIARRFPHAERRVLTHLSVSEKAAPMDALLANTGLVHGYFRFPIGSGQSRRLLSLAADVRRWEPDLLVHLHEPRGIVNALRDYLFFAMCGAHRQIGVPLRGDLQKPRLIEHSTLYEHRSDYLARKIASLGDARTTSNESWDLSLTEEEYARGRVALAPLSQCVGILAMSIGTKVDSNDWGDANWIDLLQRVGARLPDWGLVAIGAEIERGRSEALLSHWKGTRLNLCGLLSVRESATVLKSSRIYVGHDSGPMHLAAAVGTPCVAIFSARNLPGQWYPYGDKHTVFYERTDCMGCHLDYCTEFKKKCIRSISPAMVANAVVAKASPIG
jgi:ADP-heptose:LPS heptosyltransferase